MATLTDLQNKRSEMTAAIANYKQALQDFKDGAITEADKNVALTAAQDKGDEYAKLAGQVKRDNPELTSDQFYSNPALMTQQLRDDVATIMRDGVLQTIEGLYDDFNGAVLDTNLWTVVKATETEPDGTIQFLNDPDGTKFARLKSGSAPGTAVETSFFGLLSTLKLPVGGIYKTRVRIASQNERYNALIGMGNDPDRINPNGNTAGNPGLSIFNNANDKISYSVQSESGQISRVDVDVVGLDQWSVFEIHRPTATSLILYRDDVQIRNMSGYSFHGDYSLWLGTDAITAGNYIDIDYAVMIPPAT